eukprot:gene20371-26439_t
MEITDSSSQSSILPKAWKTGTTIVGIVFKDGIVLGADTRATAPNIYCCGAGTAADTEKTTDLIASNLELMRLSSGNVSAALILGGVDIHGPHLYSIQPHGSSQRLPYTTMGSGSLAAMAVFESRYIEDLDELPAIELVRDAIRAGIFNDLGSGSNIDITVIRKDGTTTQNRNYEIAAGYSSTYKAKFNPPEKLIPPPGTTFVIDEIYKPHKNVKPKASDGSSSAGSIPTTAMDIAA